MPAAKEGNHTDEESERAACLPSSAAVANQARQEQLDPLGGVYFILYTSYLQLDPLGRCVRQRVAQLDVLL